MKTGMTWREDLIFSGIDLKGNSVSGHGYREEDGKVFILQDSSDAIKKIEVDPNTVTSKVDESYLVDTNKG